MSARPPLGTSARSIALAAGLRLQKYNKFLERTKEMKENVVRKKTAAGTAAGTFGFQKSHTRRIFSGKFLCVPDGCLFGRRGNPALPPLPHAPHPPCNRRERLSAHSADAIFFRYYLAVSPLFRNFALKIKRTTHWARAVDGLPDTKTQRGFDGEFRTLVYDGRRRACAFRRGRYTYNIYIPL